MKKISGSRRRRRKRRLGQNKVRLSQRIAIKSDAIYSFIESGVELVAAAIEIFEPIHPDEIDELLDQPELGAESLLIEEGEDTHA